MMTDYLNRYGYWAIFLGILLEDFGIPLPGEILMITGALLAEKNQLNVAWLMALAITGAFIGDNIGYVIGYFGGRSVILKYGKFVLMDEKSLKKLEDFFTRYGKAVVICARFVEGLRQFNGIIAGAMGMKWKRFAIYNLVGSVFWVTFWCGFAYSLGSAFNTTWLPFLSRHYYTLIGLGSLLILLTIIFFRSKARHIRNV